MLNFISNAFSLQMVDDCAVLAVTPADWDEIPEDVICAIGHEDTARIASQLAGKTLEANRISIALHKGDVLFVVQVMGGRLPEGCTQLPEGIQIELRKVIIL
jgi:hypothetical protein